MMPHHIDVSSALRQSVSQTYSHLVTRSTGAAVREHIQRQLAPHTGDGEVAIIDFSHVGLMDFSCADEIVAKLLLHGLGEPRQFMFSGLSDAHVEAIDTVLERHGMALVSHEADSRTFKAGMAH